MGGLIVVAAALGCAATVHPPRNVSDSVEVFISDYGRHAGLVLPTEDGSYVEYAYGEWAWYAQGQMQWYRVFPVLFMNTPGTLGRQHYSEAYDKRQLLGVVLTHDLRSLHVERERCRQLRDRLDEAFDRHADRAVYRSDVNLTFVPHDTPYCLSHECTAAVADWLRALDCGVSGVSLVGELVPYRD